MPAVLFILSSASKNLMGGRAGWYLPEAAHPYWILAPHATIDFASPAGPNPPLDPRSVEPYKDDKESVSFLEDETVKQKLANAKKLSEVNVKDYDAIFYVGGHGPVLDLAFDEENARLASEAWKEGRIVSAVCHGPAALVKTIDAHGKPIFAGRRFTAFSNVEEELFGTVKEVPFSVEDKTIELGGLFEKAAEPWASHVVVDGKFITGENPASAAGVGQAILKALQ
ncbi:ThiJ/PfpI [Coprinellus micaceus]|uniref:D-lactate dehydratase n=1 Tax=Coprinellus micaceus TaxID=71717 RepID=A0A4Y7TQU1_COPMI|nr:ThiJ/PfpI [Coprinellus micaceus]